MTLNEYRQLQRRLRDLNDEQFAAELKRELDTLDRLEANKSDRRLIAAQRERCEVYMQVASETS